jgi:chromosome segregation ATPase
MKSLSITIRRHTEALAALRAQIDSISESVETKTAEAREKLLTYRTLKQQTENALDDVAAEYEQAQHLYRQADELLDKMKELRTEHVSLCRLAVKQAEPELVMKLQQAREQLKKLYEQIQRLRAESYAERG